MYEHKHAIKEVLTKPIKREKKNGHNYKPVNATCCIMFSESHSFSNNFLKIAWYTSICCGADVHPNLSEHILNHL